MIDENEDRIAFFVNDQDVWPKEGQPALGFGSSGGQTTPLKRPIEYKWLKPNTFYWLEVERLEGHNDRQPIGLRFEASGFGTDAIAAPDESERDQSNQDLEIGELAITIDGIDGVWHPK